MPITECFFRPSQHQVSGLYYHQEPGFFTAAVFLFNKRPPRAAFRIRVQPADIMLPSRYSHTMPEWTSPSAYQPQPGYLDAPLKVALFDIHFLHGWQSLCATSFGSLHPPAELLENDSLHPSTTRFLAFCPTGYRFFTMETTPIHSTTTWTQLLGHTYQWDDGTSRPHTGPHHWWNVKWTIHGQQLETDSVFTQSLTGRCEEPSTVHTQDDSTTQLSLKQGTPAVKRASTLPCSRMA